MVVIVGSFFRGLRGVDTGGRLPKGLGLLGGAGRANPLFGVAGAGLLKPSLVLRLVISLCGIVISLRHSYRNDVKASTRS